jgi:membrane protease YdiL (CAAX protease family)
MDAIKSILPQQRTQTRAVGIFLLLAFSFAWIPFFMAFATGALDGTQSNSWTMIAGIGFPFGAAVSAFIVRQFMTREGYKDVGLRWRIPLRYYVLAVGLPMLWSSIALAFNLLISGEKFVAVPSPPELIMYGVQLIVTALILFGEEFGWRSYLLRKWQSLGTWRALITTSLIWGLWHIPIVMMPSIFIVDDIGSPFIAIPGQIVYVTLLGILIGWIYLKSASIWPAMLMHGVSNTWIAFLNGFLDGGTPLTYGVTTWLWSIPPLCSVIVLALMGQFKLTSRTEMQRISEPLMRET